MGFRVCCDVALEQRLSCNFFFGGGGEFACLEESGLGFWSSPE